MFWEYDAVTLDHALLESSLWYDFTEFLSSDHVLEIYGLNIEENHPFSRLSWKFSHTLKTTIPYNMCKSLCLFCYSFIFKVKWSFVTASVLFSCFKFLFWFSSAILLSKMKLLFFRLWKFTKFLMSFLKAQGSFSSNFASPLSVMKHNSSVLFNASIIYFCQKEPINV